LVVLSPRDVGVTTDAVVVEVFTVGDVGETDGVDGVLDDDGEADDVETCVFVLVVSAVVDVAAVVDVVVGVEEVVGLVVNDVVVVVSGVVVGVILVVAGAVVVEVLGAVVVLVVVVVSGVVVESVIVMVVEVVSLISVWVMLSWCCIAASDAVATGDIVAPPGESLDNRSDQPAAIDSYGLTDTLEPTSGRNFAKLVTGSCLMSSTSRLAVELDPEKHQQRHLTTNSRPRSSNFLL
jgi:hypothetical protein